MINKKTGKLDFIIVKNFCSSKEVFKKVKRQSTNWETIFTIHMPDKGFLFRIFKNFYN